MLSKRKKECEEKHERERETEIESGRESKRKETVRAKFFSLEMSRKKATAKYKQKVAVIDKVM